MYINHFFTYSACAQLIIAPFDNVLVGYNREASRLLQRDKADLDKASAAELFADCLPEFMLFTQRLVDKGQAWCDRLLLSTGDSSIRVEVQGTCSVIGEETLLHLTLSPAEELQRRRSRSDGRHYFRNSASLRNRDRDGFERIEGCISGNWPANREQLERLLDNQPALANDVDDDGQFPTTERRSIPRSEDVQQPLDNGVLTTDELKHWERQNLILAITKTEGRIFGPGGAADLVGMKPTTLSAKLKRYGIDRRDFTPEALSKRA